MSESRITNVTPKAPSAPAANARRPGHATQPGAADPFAAMLAQSVESLQASGGNEAGAAGTDAQGASDSTAADAAMATNTGEANTTASAAAAAATDAREGGAAVDAAALTKELALDQAQRLDPNAIAAGPHTADGNANARAGEPTSGRLPGARRYAGNAANTLTAANTATERGNAAVKADANAATDPADAARALEVGLQRAIGQANPAAELSERFADRLEAATAATSASHAPAPGAAGTQASSGTHNGFGVQSYEATPSTGTFSIAAPLDTPAWPEQFGHVVRLMSRDEISSAEVRVHPAELGPIEVRLAIEGDRAEISFSASSAETRALLEAHMPKLREALESSGLQLSQTSVQSGPQRDTSQPDSSAFGQSGGNDQGNGTGRNDATADTVNEVRIGRRTDRMVDVFA